MAGIEKVCELSGEYASSDMYWYKHNQLQILPEYRKNFRGDKGTLFVIKTDDVLLDKVGGSTMSYSEALPSYGNWRVVPTYMYFYVTKNKALFGNVKGIYNNTTNDLPTVLRKIKRLTRDYNLKVIELEKFVTREEYIALHKILRSYQ